MTAVHRRPYAEERHTTGEAKPQREDAARKGSKTLAYKLRITPPPRPRQSPAARSVQKHSPHRRKEEVPRATSKKN